MRGLGWEMEQLGEVVEYPGHPLVLATMIADRYHSYEHAAAIPVGQPYGNAISDNFIPGAGCAVSCALHVLKLALAGDEKAAVERAEDYWRGWVAQSILHEPARARGEAQAERILPAFRERVAAWRENSPIPSRYRVSKP